MSVLIWIQTVCHSDCVSERILEKVNFDKKSADGHKSVKYYPACKELMHLLMLILMILDVSLLICGLYQS